MAETHGVCPRTLANWMALGRAERPSPPGRPRIPETQRELDRDRVRAVLESLSWSVGEGTVWAALGGDLTRSRVRHALRVLKAERRGREKERRAAQRTSTRVHDRDAMWCVDAAHVGRTERGRALQAEVVRDVASGVVIGTSLGPAAQGVAVRRMLTRIALRRGGAPLVLAHDNGGAYRSREVRAWCTEQRVLPLVNRPRTPQHNAVAERGMRELKEAGAAELEEPLDVEQARARLEAAIELADGAWPRPSLGGGRAKNETRSWPAGSWRGAAERPTRRPLAGSRGPCSTARIRVPAASPPARRSWARSRTMNSSHEPEDPDAIQAELGRSFV